MKRLAMCALGIAAMFVRAGALPPDDKDLKGEYWDEWNVDKVEFLAGGKAVWTTFATKEEVKGAFWIPEDGKLVFTPDDGKAAVRSWKCGFQDGFMILTDASGRLLHVR